MAQSSPVVASARAPGKVNLGLWVGPVSSDGFHPLLTAFQAVDVWEEVHVIDADDLQLEVVSDLDISGVPLGPDNLAWRAAILLADHLGLDPRGRLVIDKSVPVAGGMAGGSADAAATLKALGQHWRADLSSAQWSELATQLGSDVPFCLLGTAAIGRGRGEQLDEVSVSSPLHLVMVQADFASSTAEVYRHYDQIHPGATLPTELPEGFVAAWQSGDATALAPLLHNDLERAACSLRPEISETLAAVEQAGALRAIVSGSGPTVMGLARDADHAHDIATTLGDSGHAVRVTQSLPTRSG